MEKRHQKDIEYDFAIPPYGTDYYHMSAETAKKYFQWFQAIIPERMQYLQQRFCRDSGVHSDVFDYSANSLIPLWEWFCGIAVVVPTPDDELEIMRQKATVFGKSYINYTKFSVGTKYVMRDIGIYLGQCFVKQYEPLSWTYFTKPKNNINVNQPIITGFWVTGKYEGAANYNPLSAVRGRAANIFEHKQNANDLYETFVKWERYIPVSNHK